MADQATPEDDFRKAMEGDQATSVSFDPHGILNQPTLVFSTGRVWLIAGGIFAAVSLGVLIPMTQLPPPGIAAGSAIAVAALYLAMVIVRFSVVPGKRRLRLLALGMLAIAAVSLVATATVAATAVTA